MPRQNHSHYEGGPPCRFSTKKACDDNYADWQAMQQVLLAYDIAVRGDMKPWKKEKSAFAQLVLYIAGERDDITNEDGNPSTAPWVVRLRAAVERVKASDLPLYNLYRPGR